MNGVTKQTRYYLGDYEEEVDASGNIRKIHYLSGGAMLISNNGQDSFLFGYADYQGSLIALTNQNGNVLERYAYDPWGQRRNPSNWTQSDTRTSWRLNRGYTGHEHLDAFGIINMNGRVYDPLTAQFFSPDPFVQAPDNWLNYNRYGYCYNNPFRNTDPSGNFIVEAMIIYGLMYGVANTVIHNQNGDIHNFWDGLGYFTQGAIAGAVTGAVIGGLWELGCTGLASTSIWGKIGGGLIKTGFGTSAVSTAASLVRNPKNAVQIIAGGGYTDENRGFWDGLWQGISRNSWEFLQSYIGYNYTQFRNACGNVDRVDYLGGATYVTNENYSERGGVSLGNYLNINIEDEIVGSFEKRVTSDPLFMHEYGHTFDSQYWGVGYLIAIGIPSAIASKTEEAYMQPEGIRDGDFWYTERWANKHAANYFGKHYSVDWNGTSPYYPDGGNTIETYFPRKDRRTR